MRSYLLQWLVFFLICLCFGSSDEKPFLSNLIQTAGRKIQKAVSFLKKSTPVSSSTISKTSSTSDADFENSKNELNSESKKWSNEQFMEMLKKIADSDSEGITEAKDVLKEIEISKSSGKSLTQAINGVAEKRRTSPTQKKCISLGFIPMFFLWFQNVFSGLLRARRGAVEDTGTEMRNTRGNSLLSRLINRRRRFRPTTELIEDIQPQVGEEVEFVFEEGVPVRRIIRRVPTESTRRTIIPDRLPTTQLPDETRITETLRRPIVNFREPPVQTQEARIVTQPPVTTGRTDSQSLPPTISSNQTTRVLQPPSVSTETRFRPLPNPPASPPMPSQRLDVVNEVNRPLSEISRTVRFLPQPPTVSTETSSRLLPEPQATPPTPSQRLDIVNEVNRPLSEIIRTTRFLPQPPTVSTETSSRLLPGPQAPPPTPSQLLNFVSEVNRLPPEIIQTETVQPGATNGPISLPPIFVRPPSELRTISEVRPATPDGQQSQVIQFRQNPNTELPVTGIFRRDGEEPVPVVLDRETNTFIRAPNRESV